MPTVLSGGIGALDLTFTVQDATGYPTGAAGPFYVTLARGAAGEEKVLCDSRSGLTFTVNATGRGADGTVATSHAASSTTVEHTITKTDVDEANAHVNQTAEGDSPHPQYMKTPAANTAYLSLAGTVRGTIITSAAQSLTSGTLTALSFNSEVVDDDNFWSSGGRLTVTQAGTYLVTGTLLFAVNSTGSRRLDLTQNGVRIAGARQPASNDTALSVPAIMHAVAGDYFRMEALQDSGGALNVDSARFSCIRLRS